MLPMYQSEAMWINFDSPQGYPFAVKIAAGKINAITGDQWTNELNENKQDYVAIPDQPWLDGFHTADESVRQFIAIPLDEGYSAEEQLTGKAEHGGVQIIVYPMKADKYKKLMEARNNFNINNQIMFCAKPIMKSSCDMGLGAGGRINQEIFDDENEVQDYEINQFSRCFVQLVNSEQWQEITDSLPPTKPFSASEYEQYGLPWFDFYSDKKALVSGDKLKNLKGIASLWLDKNGEPLEDNDSITTNNVKKISKDGISDGDW